MKTGSRSWKKNLIIQRRMRHGNWFQDQKIKCDCEKWVFINKINEDGQVTKNKERLVCKRYAKVKGIDFEETFAPMAIMEVIRMILVYVFSKRIKVYQMDIKTPFLSGELDE